MYRNVFYYAWGSILLLVMAVNMRPLQFATFGMFLGSLVLALNAARELERIKRRD